MTANTDVRQLLPCPFCGGTDLNTEGDNAVWCKNRQCEAGIDFGHYVGSAAREAVHAAWNRRAALSAPEPAAPVPDAAEMRDWLIYYDDPAKGVDVFHGPNAEDAARETFAVASQNWRCRLFHSVRKWDNRQLPEKEG